MALIKCKECGKDVSSQAEKCPNCGATVAKPKQTSSTTIIVFCCVAFFLFLGLLNSCQKEQPVANSRSSRPVVEDGFLNKPMKIGPFEMSVTQVKETKRIGKYKPKNTYLQVFATIKNTSAHDANAPHFSLHNIKVSGLSPCIEDSRFILDNVKGSLMSAEWIKAGETKTGYIPMTCDDYIRAPKAPERNSKPADFRMLVNDKLNSKNSAWIYFKDQPTMETVE
ncbi:MAG: hypothetical protein ACI37O_07820 [Candidatus Avelusimicrobium sp.]|uniref:hypothetical protein n=1 Tax=Candidatus Avelusimicrobium sp. TaxID=3048833 RepID=UPI003F06B5A3